MLKIKDGLYSFEGRTTVLVQGDKVTLIGSDCALLMSEILATNKWSFLGEFKGVKENGSIIKG